MVESDRSVRRKMKPVLPAPDLLAKEMAEELLMAPELFSSIAANPKE